MIVPNHVGIIVDGNGRWATQKGKKRSEGHLAGSKNLDSLCQYIFDKGVKILSLYVFSTENFKRSDEEVNYLMDLFIKKFKNDFKIFNKKDIKIVFSGRREPLRQEILDIIDDITYKTKDNKSGILNFCLNYGSHAEIIDAVKKINKDIINNKLVIDELNDDIFKNYLYNNLPDVDLLIRTGGEVRLSNFMLWQCAYAELYFTDILFPDFNEAELEKALDSYSKRDRRYGGINYEKKSN
ncbi:MAG TPA: di-trans,poly-cis-decaprenylcistransferase [Candidatus Faecisoma merdavium]|nr:di-trans,poly-cis-decaprenylcistransferase [Candidatus Faecisoma merdavium]